MIYGCNGYPLTFVQRERCRDGTAHLCTYIYKFHSPKTKLFYIVRCEYHREDVFAVKFYCKKDRHSDYKYSKLTNKGDVGNILVTCLKVIPLLLQEYPNASFCFVGASRLVENRSEGMKRNIRFRIYSDVARNLIGSVLFTHYSNGDISSYLLLNNNCKDREEHKNAIQQMFADTYREINLD
ncbi:MAG: hypothetical protein QM610_00320 [Chitinophagaceae bacterium]